MDSRVKILRLGSFGHSGKIVHMAGTDFLFQIFPPEAGEYAVKT
jgi:hypothetical protein